MNSINSPFNLPTFIAAIKWLTQVIDVLCCVWESHKQFIQATNDARQQRDKSNEDLLYGSMKQAYQFFMDNDDESKDVVIQEIADEFSIDGIWLWGIAQENQSLEAELARLELHKQDLDDEVRVLVNVGKEIPQVPIDWRDYV